MTPRHLYVHVPFCARRCSYCDFAVHVDRKPRLEAWTRAIGAELRQQAGRLDWVEPVALRTLYVGGGTPSLLGAPAMAALRRTIAPFVLDAAEEWTAEANPESFDAEVAAAWRTAGVNRLSLGVQTFHPPALEWMGRLHGPEGPARAMADARAAGFQDVSVDLIFALPERLERDWKDDLERTLALDPDHVSLYGLTAEPGAALGRWVREGRATLPDEERYADEYMLAVETLTAAGFQHYEVSNFARPGHRSRHNRAYWTGAPYLGLGPGAHSFVPPVRSWNVRDWREYASTLERDGSPVSEREQLDAGQLQLERIWLGLRHDGGVSIEGQPAGVERLLDGWQAQGWLRTRSPVRLSAAGWLLLDRLAVELDAAMGTGAVDSVPVRRAHSARPQQTAAS